MIFTKRIQTNRYIILFNKTNGVEVLSGINGHEDPFILDSPSMIDIGIMGHCLNNCEICYQGDIDIPNMKLEDFKLIIDQCKNHINQVALGGKGDPNKHEHFEEILKYCRQNNVVPNYTTSGNGLTDKEIKITKEFVGAAAISMYNKDFTYLALNKFLDAKIKTNIHFVISQKTFDDGIKILNGVDIWEGKFPIDKLNAVVFLLFKPQGNGANKNYLCLTNDQIAEFADLLLNPKCIFKIGCDSCMFNKVSQVRQFTDIEKLCVDTCEAARMSSYISPDMNFMPCSFGDRLKYGIQINKNNSIQNIWELGKPFLEFRKELKENPMSCPYDLL